ncbi:sigma-70 family RNA polymerase sigma factor [Microbacterium aurugineum]
MDWASRGIRKRIKETVAVRETLTAGLGRTATATEVATAMGVTKDVVVEALGDAARTVTTLDDPAARDVATEIPLPEESALVGERRDILEQAVAALPERMRRIVQAVYFDERPVKEIAEELGVTHSAVSQQRSEAIRLLRDALDRYFAEGAAPTTTTRVSAGARDAYFSRIADASSPRIADIFREAAPA